MSLGEPLNMMQQPFQKDARSMLGNNLDSHAMLQTGPMGFPLDSVCYFPDSGDCWSNPAQGLMLGHWETPLDTSLNGNVPDVPSYSPLLSTIPSDPPSQPLPIPQSYISHSAPITSPVGAAPSTLPFNTLNAIPVPTTIPGPSPSHLATAIQRRHSTCSSSSQGTTTTTTPPTSRGTKSSNRRASHNLVEKRYRINLNSKFRKLEEVVMNGTEPRVADTSTTGTGTRTGTETGTSTTTGKHHHSPKASIIDDALGYIENLQSEIGVLRGKLSLLEKQRKPQPVKRVHHDEVKRESQ